MTRVGLMGFGRIGRNVFRLLTADDSVEVAAIADVADPEALTYLLKYDSIYGRFPKPVELDGSNLVLDGTPIPFLNAAEPGDADWSEHGVDIVIQATGKYRTREWCEKHLAAGAKRVILASTPEVPGDVPILLRGINDEILTPDLSVVSLGSNTSNALAPILRIFDQTWGLDRAYFTTVHAFTNQARLADVPTSSFRSSRAAGENIIPSSTNSPEILTHVMPELEGKLSAMALNVPVPDGSTVDLVAFVRTATTAAEVNETVRKEIAASYEGIIEFVDDPIVSSDVIGSSQSGNFDSLATMVVDGTMIKSIVWFDNGWGYSVRLVEVLNKMTEQLEAV
ncbi:MAG: type I glyceraldehyde-3-phosphate dehydrogenase [Acidimicrobiia bacterium]|nr:glyceraldehyde-3-phosphate dehydrogenase [Acidimicrobiia bacterium]NNF10961.1 type I glyceraldehyde-3-phosphate dehydrogenase [Acidimicrobiia bacterium]NNL69981.1 type I glyceraldehyde-3-phosphate dehydrogenase [Acidimicrobiia bacterium]